MRQAERGSTWSEILHLRFLEQIIVGKLAHFQDEKYEEKKAIAAMKSLSELEVDSLGARR